MNFSTKGYVDSRLAKATSLSTGHNTPFYPKHFPTKGPELMERAKNAPEKRPKSKR